MASWYVYNHLAWACNVAYPCMGAMRRPEIRDEREVRFSHAFLVSKRFFSITVAADAGESVGCFVVAIMLNK